MRAFPLLLAVVLLAPAALAQTVGGPAPPPADTGYSGPPIVVPLYGHVYDLLQKAPMNTQPMIDLDLARGFGNPSVSRSAVAAGAFAETSRFYLFSSPGLVEYNITDEKGLPRYHPERGISYDVLLETSKSIVGHWFMSAKALDVPQQGMTDGPEAGVLPQFTVRMTMRAGDDIGADLDAGVIIAQGEATLSDPASWVINGEAVEFIIDMGTPLVDRIDGDEAFNLKVEWFNADANGVTVTQRDWILHTGSRYPNRIELAIANPLALYSIRPTPVGDDLIAIRTELNSPFGNYDVDVSTLEMSISGPSVARSVAAPIIVQKSFEHNHHYEPVLVTWTWPFQQDAAKPGTYTVTVKAQNLQGTAMVEKTATFVIPEKGRAVGYADDGAVVQAADADAANETPSVALLSLLAVLGLVALFRRR